MDHLLVDLLWYSYHRSSHRVRLQYGELALMLRQVRQAHRWRDRVGYLFAPPGWAPTPDA